MTINIEESSQLLDYLRRTNKIASTETPTFERLDGGVSNRTVWVKREHDSDWILKQALEKLRVQVDWFSAPERIHREAAGLRWLERIIPEHTCDFIFEDEQHHILAMSVVPQPHDNWKTSLLNGSLQIEHATLFGQLLARIHNAIEDHPRIADEFADRGFFEELRLEPYYTYTATQVPDAKEHLLTLVEETRQRQLALVHGDYSPKNVLVHKNSLIILDFEVIHFGDPAFDIGFSLTHFLSKAHYLEQYRDTFIQMAHTYWQAYHKMISEDLLSQHGQRFAVHHTLACLLARVAGRSPLEYLDAQYRQRQQLIVVELMNQDIQTIPELIDAFEERLNQPYDKN